MYWFLNPRVIVGLVLLVALGATHFTAYRLGKAMLRAEWDKDKAVQTAKLLEQEQLFRKKEQALVAAKSAAEKRYVDEKRKAATAAVGAQSALDGLRDTLATAPACPAPSDPAAASRAAGAARLERDLLGACAEALVNLGRDADLLEARLVGLQEYVKNVCLAPR
jgi:hypothetical protein